MSPIDYSAYNLRQRAVRDQIIDKLTSAAARHRALATEAQSRGDSAERDRQTAKADDADLTRTNVERA